MSSSAASNELKIYQALVFSIPIFFAFILVILFYFVYIRRRRVDWSSLRMTVSHNNDNVNEISIAELGLKKTLREMIPIVIFKESFAIRDTQCSVCLADYKAEDKLQQIPACGHAFHMECIDNWLTGHSTCPLCRLSLLPKAPAQYHNNQQGSTQQVSVSQSIHPTMIQSSRDPEEPRVGPHPEVSNEDARGNNNMDE